MQLCEFYHWSYGDHCAERELDEALWRAGSHQLIVTREPKNSTEKCSIIINVKRRALEQVSTTTCIGAPQQAQQQLHYVQLIGCTYMNTSSWLHVQQKQRQQMISASVTVFSGIGLSCCWSVVMQD